MRRKKKRKSSWGYIGWAWLGQRVVSGADLVVREVAWALVGYEEEASIWGIVWIMVIRRGGGNAIVSSTPESVSSISCILLVMLVAIVGVFLGREEQG